MLALNTDFRDPVTVSDWHRVNTLQSGVPQKQFSIQKKREQGEHMHIPTYPKNAGWAQAKRPCRVPKHSDNSSKGRILIP